MGNSSSRNLRERLNREVHHSCPICGGFPLVLAHTIKEKPEVSWDYEYLLAICRNCEDKVTKGLIDREVLHTLKQKYRKSINKTERLRPLTVPYIGQNDFYLGSNFISKTDVVISQSGLPVIWVEEAEGVKVLGARLQDKKGQIISTIDKNMWMLDLNRFFDFKSEIKEDKHLIEIVSFDNETKIKLIFDQKSLHILESTFFIGGNRVIVNKDDELLINSHKLINNTLSGGGIDFSVSEIKKG